MYPSIRCQDQLAYIFSIFLQYTSILEILEASLSHRFVTCVEI